MKIAINKSYFSPFFRFEGKKKIGKIGRIFISTLYGRKDEQKKKIINDFSIDFSIKHKLFFLPFFTLCKMKNLLIKNEKKKSRLIFERFYA